MRNLIILLMSLLFVQNTFASGWLVIGKVTGKHVNVEDAPLKICYDYKYDVYHPSRIFDINHIESKYVVYDLHIVYTDSCSEVKLKTVQVKIPKKFKGICCYASSERLVYSFKAGKREIAVSIPAIEQDTLKRLVYSEFNSYPSDSMLKYRVPRVLPVMYERYMGVMQTNSYTLYYYNFSRRQKEILERM